MIPPGVYYTPNGRKLKVTQVQCTQFHDVCKLCIQYVTTVFANCAEWLHHDLYSLHYMLGCTSTWLNCTLFHSTWGAANLGEWLNLKISATS